MQKIEMMELFNKIFENQTNILSLNGKFISETSISLLKPVNIKTGVLATMDDYMGLFLSRDYILSLKDEMSSTSTKNAYVALLNEAIDLFGDKGILDNNEIETTEERQILEEFFYDNINQRRIETGYLNLGIIDGVFIRGDNLLGFFFDENNEEAMNKKYMKDFIKWRYIATNLM